MTMTDTPPPEFEKLRKLAEKSAPSWGELVEIADALPTLLAAYTALAERAEKAEGLAYVPGLHKCAKCGCATISTNLHYPSGGFSANNDPQTCPNGCGPMWPVTERQAGNEMVNRCEAQQKRAERAEAELAALRERVKTVAAKYEQKGFDDIYIVRNDHLASDILAALAAPPSGEEGDGR